VTEIDVLRKVPHGGPCPVGVWWGALCNVGPHPRLKTAPAAGFHFVSSEEVDGFAIDHYRAPRPIRVYAHWPFETPDAGSKRTRTLMVTPTAAPEVP
jgi:hypothetical protein